MCFLADYHRKRGGAEQPPPVHVPALSRQHVVACRGKAGEVCHRGTGDERPFCRSRQVESLFNPPQSSHLEACDCRRAYETETVLIPRRRETLGGDSRWQRAASHKPKVTAARTSDGCGRSMHIEKREDFASFARLIWQGNIKCSDQSINRARQRRDISLA